MRHFMKYSAYIFCSLWFDIYRSRLSAERNDGGIFYNAIRCQSRILYGNIGACALQLRRVIRFANLKIMTDVR